MTLRVFARRALVTLAAVSLLTLATGTGLRLLGKHQLGKVSEAFSRDIGPLDLAAYNQPPVPPEANAMPALSTAAKALTFGGDPQTLTTLRRLAESSPKVWSGEDLRFARTLVAAQGGPLAQFDEAATRPAARLELDYTQGYAMYFQGVNDELQLSRVATLRGHLAVLDGDFDVALRSLHGLATLARGWSHEGQWLLMLQSHLVTRRQLAVFQELLARPDLDEATLTRALATLPADTAKQQFRTNLGVAAAMIRAVVDQPELFRAGPLRSSALKALFPATAARTIDYYRRCGLTAETVPYPDSVTACPSWQVAFGGTPFASLLAIDVSRLVGRVQAFSAQLALAHRAGALRLAGLTTGSYPATGTTPPALPFTANPPQRIDHPDGSVELTLPGGAETWLELRGSGGSFTRLAGTDLFTWHLPAVP